MEREKEMDVVDLVVHWGLQHDCMTKGSIYSVEGAIRSAGYRDAREMFKSTI